MTPLYFVHFKFILHRIWLSWLLNKDMIWGKTLYFVRPKSTLHRIWPSWLLSKDMIWGKPFYFVHLKFTLLCMSILTLEHILLWGIFICSRFITLYIQIQINSDILFNITHGNLWYNNHSKKLRIEIYDTIII